MTTKHQPVLLKEVIDGLAPQKNCNYIDCTLGGGGYTRAILEQILPKGEIIAIEADAKAIQKFKNQNKNNKNVSIVNKNFRYLHKIWQDLAKERGLAPPRSIVFDLGLSSDQLADRSRGFSFLVDAPLDMRFAHTRINTDEKRMDPSVRLGAGTDDIQEFGNNSTEEIVNRWSREELVRILREYGEERFANRIAAEIVSRRKIKPIKTTFELVEIIKQAVPKKFQQGKIHPATRTFQALRIATNDELESLRLALPQALETLGPGGRLAVVSFHSLEDRIVKQFFKRESRDCVCSKEMPICQCEHKAQLKIITKKPIIPSEEEIKKNPRSRSAKLRLAEKI